MNTIARHEENTLVEKNEAEQARFEMMSAGLVNFSPAIKATDHETIYQQLLYHRRLSLFEQGEPAALDYVRCEGEADKCIAYLKSKPAIVCTMHTGSYRLINLLLLREGIPFTLVAGSTVLKREGAVLQQIYHETKKNRDDALQLIDAEQGNAGLKMIRALKGGRSLVLYIDGHTGAGERTNMNANSCIVDFLAQQLYVRKGIAQLAFATCIPIIPVLCYRKGMDGMRLRFYDPFFPDAFLKNERYAELTTQQLYTLFAEVIKEYPEQWEGWLTIHKNAKIINDNTYPGTVCQKKGEKTCFNRYRFGIFKTAGMPYLLEKHTYLFYALEPEMYELLQRCRNAPVDCAEIDSALLTFLHEKGVLEYADDRCIALDHDYTCE